MEYTKSNKMIKAWFLRNHNRSDPFQLSEISGSYIYVCVKFISPSNMNHVLVVDGGEEEEDDDGLSSPSAVGIAPHNQLRIFVGTWNVAGRSPMGCLAVDLDEWLHLKDAADVYVLGFQEIVPLKAATVIGAEDPTEAMNWNTLIGNTLNETKFSRYILMASKKMVGVFISVWMRSELIEKYDVSGAKVCAVGCGIMGYLGNKGSVSVSMSIGGTSFCFIAAHLASGEKKGDEGRRNHQVVDIFRRTTFPRLVEDDTLHPLTILGHDQIFWFGDLNYRLCLEDKLARQLIKEQDWRALQRFDQLRRELHHGGVFQGWKEGNIQFAPTYKYSSYNCNRYSGGIPPRAGEKQRTPAWCDRILWYGRGVTQHSYFRSESKFSDHRPVSALFSVPIRVKSRNNDCNHRNGMGSEEGPATLMSLLAKNAT